MNQYKVLRVARVVLLVLAYVAGISNVVFAGFWPLVAGGQPVLLFDGGPEISVRIVGLLNILLTAPLVFLFFYVPSGTIHLLLEIRERVGNSGPVTR